MNRSSLIISIFFLFLGICVQAMEVEQEIYQPSDLAHSCVSNIVDTLTSKKALKQFKKTGKVPYQLISSSGVRPTKPVEVKLTSRILKDTTIRFKLLKHVKKATTNNKWNYRENLDTVSVLGICGDRKIVTGSTDGKVWVRDCKTKEKICNPVTCHDQEITFIAVSHDTKRIATTSQDNKASVWNASLTKSISTLEHEDVVTAAAFSPDGQTLVTACEGILYFWDIDGQELLNVFDPQNEGLKVTALAWNHEDKIAVGYEDQTIVVYDHETCEELCGKYNCLEIPHFLAWNENGNLLAVGYENSKAHLLDGKTLKRIHVFKSLENDAIIQPVGFTDDGNELIMVSRGTKVCVFTFDLTSLYLVHEALYQKISLKHSMLLYILDAQYRTNGSIELSKSLRKVYDSLKNICPELARALEYLFE